MIAPNRDIGRETPLILLILRPGNVPGVRVREEGNPLLARYERAMDAGGGAPTAPPPEEIGAGVPGIVEHADGDIARERRPPQLPLVCPAQNPSREV